MHCAKMFLTACQWDANLRSCCDAPPVDLSLTDVEQRCSIIAMAANPGPVVANRMSHDPAPVAEKFATPGVRTAFLYSPTAMVLVAFLVRIAAAALWSIHRFNMPYWATFEMANIGYALFLGHGFSDPWGLITGPTAWTAPTYPWIASLVFRMCDPYTIASAWVLVTFNSVFSALTCWTIYRIARRLFGDRVARWSGWIWAIFPLAVYWPITWIWETALSAFLMSLLFLMTLDMDGDGRVSRWFTFGLLWGIVALTSTSVLAWLPFAGCWLAYRLYRSGKRFVVPVLISAVVFWVTISPWLVRNYVVFHKFILIRGDFGSELRAGNNPEAQGEWVREYRAANNRELFDEFARIGEVADNDKQGLLAKEWIKANPGRFLSLTLRRFVYFWIAPPSSDVKMLRPLIVFLSLFSVGGLIIAARRRVPGTFLFATLGIFYPLVYYITFPTDRYRHTIEPELVILAVYCLMPQAPSRQTLQPPPPRSV
jgi:Dolichyl-phosphate-mannose-protein mannosyltransferase